MVPNTVYTYKFVQLSNTHYCTLCVHSLPLVRFFVPHPCDSPESLFIIWVLIPNVPFFHAEDLYPTNVQVDGKLVDVEVVDTAGSVSIKLSMGLTWCHLKAAFH